MKDEMTKDYVCTGVYATPAQVEAIKLERALTFACISGRWPQPERVMHEAALAQGLPEIGGFYGVDFRDNEFIRLPDEKITGAVGDKWETLPDEVRK